MTTDSSISSSDDAEVAEVAEGAEVSEAAEVIKSGEPLTGYELVADLMRRQDEVIAQIDSLNDRIESAITQLDEARKLEQQAGDASDADPDSATSLPQAA